MKNPDWPSGERGGENRNALEILSQLESEIASLLLSAPQLLVSLNEIKSELNILLSDPKKNRNKLNEITTSLLALIEDIKHPNLIVQQPFYVITSPEGIQERFTLLLGQMKHPGSNIYKD